MAEGGLELGLIVLQSMHCNHYTIEADASWAPFLILDYRKHTIAIIVSKLGLVKKIFKAGLNEGEFACALEISLNVLWRVKMVIEDISNSIRDICNYIWRYL